MRNLWLRVLFVLSLACAVISIGLGFIQNNSKESVAHNISTKLAVSLGELDREQTKIGENPAGIVWSSLKGSHFLVDNMRIKAWSKNDFLPDVRVLQDSFDIRLLQNSSGDFLLKKRVLANSQFLLAVLPLHKKYPIVNKYLSPQWNQALFQDFAGRITNVDVASGALVSFKGRPIFKIFPLEVTAKQGKASLIVVSLAFILFLIGCILLLFKLHNQRKQQTVFLIAISLFAALRVLMLAINFPVRWYSAPIFSAQEFASSSYNASLGDLFLNSLGVMFLCVYVFFTYSNWPLVRRLLKTKGLVRVSWGGLFILMTFFSFLFPFLFIETIFHNSRISLDITQTLTFDLLRTLSFSAVVLGTIGSFCFTHVFSKIARTLVPNPGHFIGALLVGGLFFIGYFVSESREYWITLFIVVPYIIILYATKLGSSLSRISYVTFLYLFFAVSAYSVQGALSVKRFVEEERVESQFRFASSYLIGRDVFAEYLLNESSLRIAKDAYIQNRLTSPFLSKLPVRQKVKQVFLNSYFDRYDVKILLFNAAKEPLDDQAPGGFSPYENELLKLSSGSDYKGVHFIRSEGVQTGKRYFAVVPIFRFDQPIGFVVLDLSLKRIIPQNVFPELLVDSRFNEYFENRDKSFAFISDKSILSSFGNFNYEKEFDFSLLYNREFYKDGIIENGFIQSGSEEESGRVAVVTSLAYPVFFVLTNFAFFFVLGIFVIGFGVALYGLYAWINGQQINYAARIQLYIYMAFALPLVIVTVTTLNRVSHSAENQLKNDFINKSRLLGENIVPTLSSYWADPDNMRSELENQVVNVARFSNVDVSIYDPSGMTVVSSQPVIVENQLTSGLMNREAWERIFGSGDNSLILNEKIGSLVFNNSYFGLKSSESGALIGVLSVPFFESALSLETTQISVLANILTVFVLIFILFTILSFFAVNSLTFPLRFITRTLSRTTLSGTNKPLEWKSNDEIGLMVTEYNRMLENLEQSKIELARSQKESAWREIAKQVAHEIKNPLTPMKLTLQQMEQSIMHGEFGQEKGNQSIRVLLTQVEILNDIASSFSSFARMPAPILQRIELIQLVRKSAALFTNYEGGEVLFQYTGDSLYLNGDEQLLSRVFSNIILNAFQAGDGKQIKVEVIVKRVYNDVSISFEDNGNGIDVQLKDKIFAPYFSTKKSGSGLGLAIAKQGIEQSGGEIWFESEVGKGTTFFVRFKLVI